MLRDWPDRDCLRILCACRAATAPAALLLIAEQILDANPARGPPTSYSIDRQMIAMSGRALERTEGEFRSLLAAAGFALRVVPTESPVSMLEAETA